MVPLLNKRKESFVIGIVLTFFFYGNAYPAPMVTNVTGSFSRGGSATIAGSSFGTKSSAGPLVWENFEAGSLNSAIRGTAPAVSNIGGSWTWQATDSGGPVFSNSVVRPNSTKSSKHDYASTYSNGLFVNTQLPSYFFSFWWYYHPVTGWSRNTKPFILSRNTNDDSPNAYIGFGQYPGDPGIRTEVIDGGGAIDPTSWGSTAINSIANRWIRFDVWLVQSSVNVKDGKFQVFVHNPDSGSPVVLDLQINPAKTRTTSNTWGSLFLQTYSSIDGGTSQTVYIDDFYLDSTQARVEICDKSTWASKTHCEIQIPTSWSASSITFNVNSGSFATLNGAFLYVVDKDGGVNSNGYVIGSSSPPPTTPPPQLTPLSPIINSIQ